MSAGRKFEDVRSKLGALPAQTMPLPLPRLEPLGIDAAAWQTQQSLRRHWLCKGTPHLSQSLFAVFGPAGGVGGEERWEG